MLNPEQYQAYLVAALLFALAPGPDMLFVIAGTLRGRFSGGLASAAGVCGGACVHAGLAAMGVSAIVTTSPFAFIALQYSGAAYLIWVGMKSLKASTLPAAQKSALPELSRKAFFKQGMITNLLNPKIILFYLALLPQFVDPAFGHIGVQMLILGLTHMLIGFFVLLCVVVMVSFGAKHAFMGGAQRWLDCVAGMIFMGLGVRLLLTGAKQAS